VDALRVEGGRTLTGTVEVSGAKNAALPILCSALLADGKSTFRNVPALRDIDTTSALLRFMGAEVECSPPVVTVDPTPFKRAEAPYELVKQMRASVLVLGPLVARHGRAVVSLPGGCAIGERPIDQHLKGLEAMGASITLEHGYVKVQAERLRGSDIVLDTPTVTGTENLMMAAVLAKGRTTILNAAHEPEVEELARVLNKMGASVEGAGTDVIRIQGTQSLHPVDHAIIPDRIEAGTFLVAAAATGGDVLVKNCQLEHLEAVAAKLRQAGVELVRQDDGVRVHARTGPLRPLEITTAPHPGFPTDMQAQLMVLLTAAAGRSVVTETIFENRFMHVGELRRMGADIEIRGRTAFVSGPTKLSGAQVMATDLRASASLVIAGLMAEGTTEILRVYHIDRGYEHIEKKLQGLGARIERFRARG